MSDFQDRVVLVTGAGSGIGREAALAFAARGAIVYCAGRQEGKLAETRRLILDAGGTAHVAPADVSEEREVASLVARIGREAGRLDIAFNNAGITGGAHRIEDYPSEDFDTVLRVNLKSVFLGMKYELPLMRRSGGGAICNTASVAALSGPGGMCAYAASKHGLLGLMRSLAAEYAKTSLTVNAVCPGYVDTPMTDQSVARVSQITGRSADDSRSIITDMNASGRLVDPQAIGNVIAMLCLPLSRDINGAAITLDGGTSA